MSTEGTYDFVPEEPRRAPRRAPAAAVPAGPAQPCPHCQYDLRGLLDPKSCPECGKRVSQARIRAAREARERKVHEQAWFPAALTLVIGVAVTGMVYGYEGANDPNAGPLIYLVWAAIQLAVSVVLGWVVYPVLAAMWIGWSASIPTTALQLAGAYAGAMAAHAVVGLLGLPRLPWLVSVLVLLGLLCWLLDIDKEDAVALAVVSWALKALIVIFALNAWMQSAGL